jgi:cytochrome c-type biogenesis protein CcsB
MVWSDFPQYAIIILILWIVGILFSMSGRYNSIFPKIGQVLLIAGIAALVTLLINLWIQLERPPLRTLGETRLWYSTFLAIVGIIFYWRWKYYWFVSYCFFMAGLFLILNIYFPENFNKALMPALHSPWFVPHVIVYIVAYALLGASSIVALKQIYDNFKDKSNNYPLIKLADNLVYIGFAFLTLGLLFGALWAKEAWGHYWTWDPKETWAFLTWAVYLVYIHARIRNSLREKVALWILAFGFVVLLMCWFGVNYLPSASNSVHTYSNS